MIQFEVGIFLTILIMISSRMLIRRIFHFGIYEKFLEYLTLISLYAFFLLIILEISTEIFKLFPNLSNISERMMGAMLLVFILVSLPFFSITNFAKIMVKHILYTRYILEPILFVIIYTFFILIFLKIVFEVIMFFPQTYGIRPKILMDITDISFSTLVVITLSTYLIYYILFFLAERTIAISIVQSLRPDKRNLMGLIDYVTRFLSTIPTLILGNAIITFLDKLEIYSINNIAKSIYVIPLLVLIGLPTVLQVMNEVMKDINKSLMMEGIIALGINQVRGSRDIIPRNSFKAAIAVSLGRIFIEGYLALNNTGFLSNSGHIILNSPTEIGSIFNRIYSTASIQSNIFLILILFVLALVVNLWALGYISVSKWS